MLGTTDIEVDILPIVDRLGTEVSLVVVGVHIAQIVATGTGKAWHRAEFEGEDGDVVDEVLVDHLAVLLVPGPHLGVSQRGFASGGGLEILDFGQLKRQALLRQHIGSVVLIVYRERLAPVTLTAEDSVTQTEIDRAGANAHLLHLVDDGLHGIFDFHAGNGAAVDGIAHLAVETLFPCVRVGEFVGIGIGGHHLTDGQIEMTCKGKVAAVVGRNSHNGPGAIASQDIFRHPDGDLLASEGIDGESSGKHTRNLFHLGLAFTFGTVLGPVDIGFHLGTMLGGGNAIYHLMFRTQHHKGDTIDSVGAGGENLEGTFGDGLTLPLIGLHARQKALFLIHGQREPYRSTLGTADPVTLYFLERVGPVYLLQSVDQTLGVGGDTETPLAHELAFDGIAATDAEAVDHLVVGQDSAQLGTPVDRNIGQIGQAEVHQIVLAFLLGHLSPRLFAHGGYLATLELLNQPADGHSLVEFFVVIVIEKLHKSPLGPMVVGGVAGADLALPVERKAYLVELLAVAGYIALGGDGRVLASLDSILLGRQAVGIVAHRMKDIEAAQTFVTRENVGGDVAQRMAYVQTCSRRIGEHVEDIKMRFVGLVGATISMMLTPIILPLGLDFVEVVIHCSLQLTFVQ